MYKIIGVDQKEYGPITAAQMREWFAQGRINAQTMVWSEASGNWKTFATYPEFSDLIAPPLTPGLGIDSGASRSVAAGKVLGPAIGLIATAVFGFLGAVAGIVMNTLGSGLTSTGNPETDKILQMFSGTMGIVSGVFAIIISGVIFYGGLKMKNLENHTLATTASWLAIVPCVSPCCCLGLPLGIWALVVLNKPEVKSQFD